MANRTLYTERLTQWVRDHAPAVRGYLLALVRDQHLADDLVQDVFCRAWEARQRYVEQGKPRAYLLRIADRLACDRQRTRHRERVADEAQWQAMEPTAVEGPPLTLLLGAEDRRQLSDALATLTEAQRRTLLLRYYGDLEFQEIAHIMECPTNTVLSHARRGLQALRRLLVEKCE